MGNALLVHLSDIHVRSDDDAILDHADHIAAAVRNLDYEMEAAIVAVSGDLAFSGRRVQYEAVWKFLRELASRLESQLSPRAPGASVPVGVFAIPGNHDCDFSGSVDARLIVVDGVLANPCQAKAPSVVDLCTQVQQPFFDALETYGTDGLGEPTSKHDHRLGYGYSVSVGDQTVRLLCFNTAWLSKQHEDQGHLYLPAEVVPAPPQGDALVVAMFHHPYKWMAANAARAFQKRVEAVADLILTGHEHDATRRAQQVSTGERNEYVEGGALQDSHNPGASAFNVFVLDVTNRKQKATEFVWDGVRYVPLGVDRDAGDGFGLEWEDLQVARLRERESFELADSMRQRLDDPGATLTHRSRGLLRLEDVFVFPDLQEVTYSSGKIGRIVPGTEVADLVTKSPRLLLVGDAKAGKSCLAKMLFRDLHQGGYVPVLVDAAAKLPSGERLHADLVRLFGEQYDPSDKHAYRQLDRARRVVIVDDYHLLPPNAEVRRAFIEDVARFAAKIVLLADNFATEASDLFDPRGRVEGTAPFATFRLLALGHARRDALVDKWLLLDDPRNTSTIEFAQKRQALTTTLNALTARNLLPPYPVYILAILQANEALTPWDSRVSTYGAYYELLIRNALAQGRAPVQSDIVLNYLAHFAYYLFHNRLHHADNKQVRAIHREFEQRYELDVNMKGMREDLVGCHVFAVSNDVTQFKYKYIYYYFVARWFRDHINDEDIRSALKDLSRSVHIEEHADILLFLAHLSREPLIFEAMLEAARSYYPEFPPATFTDDVDFLVALKNHDNRLVYKNQDVGEARQQLLASLDEHEAQATASSDRREVEEETVGDILDPLNTLAAATKTIQILGQILKNFPGSLDGTVKLEIAQECYSLGLRTLSWIYDALRDSESALLHFMAEVIRERHPKLTEKQVELRARDMIVSTAEMFGLAVVCIISSAAGSPELEQTYDRLEEQNGTPAIRLVNASIDLAHSATFPEGEVQRLAKVLASRPFAASILSHLVLARFYLFPVAEPTKQRVCAALGIQYTPKLDANPRRRLAARR